jgi:hypothetical protein
VALEGGVGQRAGGLDDLGHGTAVFLDFPLGVAVHAQLQEVEHVFEVHLPIPLGVGRERQVDAGQLAGDFGVDHRIIVTVHVLLILLEQLDLLVLQLGRNVLGIAALLVVGALEADLIARRQVEFILHDRVAAGVIQAGSRRWFGVFHSIVLSIQSEIVLRTSGAMVSPIWLYSSISPVEQVWKR